MSARRQYATLLLVVYQLACWPVARVLHSTTCQDHACSSGGSADWLCASARSPACRCGRHDSAVSVSDRTVSTGSNGSAAIEAFCSASSKRPLEKSVPHTRGSCAVCVELAKSSCLPPVFCPAEVVLPDCPVSQVIFRIPELAARMRVPARGPPV